VKVPASSYNSALQYFLNNLLMITLCHCIILHITSGVDHPLPSSTEVNL
jgi:hypothetical protein